jgi:hypothetical protein
MIDFLKITERDYVFIKNGSAIGDIYYDNNRWTLDQMYITHPELTSNELREIADKMDELKGIPSC